MFWVFNNGITALVNDFEYTSQDDVGVLQISGIAIVNGAQTTGALGAVDADDLSTAYVPARFVRCNDSATVRDIIQYNNSQNRIEVADFRSNDVVQTRLRREFEDIPEAEYTGGRRGGENDAMKRPRALLPSYTVGQCLMAFHGAPAVAYNQRSNIWKSDELYTRIFNDRTSAKHIVCAYSLMKAIDSAKSALRNVSEKDRTEAQGRQWGVLKQRGATFLVTAAFAAGLETIVNHSIHDRFAISFVATSTPQEAAARWRPIIEVALPLVARLAPALEGSNLKNREIVAAAIDDFVDVLNAVREPNADAFDTFAQILARE